MTATTNDASNPRVVGEDALRPPKRLRSMSPEMDELVAKEHGLIDTSMEAAFAFTRVISDAQMALSWLQARDKPVEKYSASPLETADKLRFMTDCLRQTGRFQPIEPKTRTSDISVAIIEGNRAALFGWCDHGTRSYSKYIASVVDRVEQQMRQYHLLASDASGWTWQKSRGDWFKWDDAKAVWVSRKGEELSTR
ncbi:Uu.00g052740.m01.CDS01 [Anthostomella pinea]|uniref:Uu.00g052740.m01.CDS01 n=1 Tax=Anthostomella pinea TaxID=933095 RepID=A0AAI8YPC5_9PEZI|nr:Uu.00g052740.m01.CDS01 [Anthostomella pinea]